MYAHTYANTILDLFSCVLSVYAIREPAEERKIEMSGGLLNYIYCSNIHNNLNYSEYSDFRINQTLATSIAHTHTYYNCRGLNARGRVYVCVRA